MNERIKQLAKQATTIEYGVDNGFDRVTVDQEKFAELIVQECIDKIETYKIYVGNSPAGELACEWTYDALKDIRDDIKETFGIDK